MGERQETGPGAPDADDIARFANALRATAERAARGRSLLRPEDAGDIADQAFLEVLQEHGSFPPLPTLKQARRAISRVADRMQKRRKRRAQRARQIGSETKAKRRGRRGKAIEAAWDPPCSPPRRPVGVPTLCRRLATLGRGTRFDARIARLVVDAAAVVVADPRGFSANEIALFTVAWRRGRSAAEIVGAAGTKTPRAVTERLKRLNKKIENSLVGYLAATLSPDRLAEMLSSEPAAKKNEILQLLATQRLTSA